jgi:septal ring factor EnvC (AmiA/AmiB activator)
LNCLEKIFLAFTLGVCSLFLPSVSHGNDDLQRELKTLEKKEVQERKKLDAQQAAEKKAQQELKKTKRDLDQINKKISQLEKQDQRFKDQIRQLKKEESRLNSSLALKQAQLSRWLHESYISGREPSTGIKPDNSVDSVYLAAISRHHSEIIQELNIELEQLRKIKEETISLRNSLKKTRRAKSKEKSKAEKKRQKESSTIKKTKNDIKKTKKSLKDIRAEKSSINELFAKLRRQKSKEIENRSLPDSSVNGKRFKSLKGHLRLPAIGIVSERFNQRREGTDSRWEGVFIESNSGNDVRSIADGRVVYSDWLRGFGNLVIIDHGDRFYSLYGNNETLWVLEDDIVTAGDKLGTVGNSGGHKSDGVYFEIRRDSTPLNPLDWVNIK